MQIGMIIDAAVDDRYGDSGSIPTRTLSHLRAHGGFGIVRGAAEGAIRRNIGHFRIGGECPQTAGWHVENTTREQVESLCPYATKAGDAVHRARRRCVLELHDHLDRLVRAVSTTQK